MGNNQSDSEIDKKERYELYSACLEEIKRIEGQVTNTWLQKGDLRQLLNLLKGF